MRANFEQNCALINPFLIKFKRYDQHSNCLPGCKWAAALCQIETTIL
jgi:hypothetical protein